jgi:hypothetical protein
MLAAAATAAAATGPRSAATAAAAASPRLTGGAARLKDPILDDRSDDLTAIDRGTGERQEARKLTAVRASMSARVIARYFFASVPARPV